MFPDIPLDRFRQVGNAAGIGERVEYLELTVSIQFQEEFLKAMYM